MSAIICVPDGAPSQPHSVPESVANGVTAPFLVPLQNDFFGDVQTILSFNLPSHIDSVFQRLGKVRTSTKTVDTRCVFTATDYALEGSFRGTVFVDVRVDGISQAAIQVNVV